VERTVQTVKSLLKRAKENKRDPFLAMLEYRITPVENLGTPTQLLMDRRTRGVLPTPPSLLKPVNKSIKNQLRERQNKQKFYYDRQTKPLPELRPGDVVRIQDEQYKKTLKSAIVKGKAEKPRSYIVSSEGMDYRRNRKHLIKTAELNDNVELDHDQDDFNKTTEQEINNQTTQHVPENTDNNYIYNKKWSTCQNPIKISRLCAIVFCEKGRW
jgi:hypothetical protein